MLDYDSYIFKMPQKEKLNIKADDVEGAAKMAKETASGMDQWAPVD